MKFKKVTSAEMVRREEIRAARQRHYDRMAAGLPPEADAPDGLHVGKGPRGKFYVKRGKEIVSGPYETEDAAKARAV